MTVEAKKQSNRAIQREHATYKKKSEISEALNLIRPYINVSTYKFLSHFLHTNGSGCTQAKITVICEKVGISTGCYSKTVKPEIENILDQPLIIKTDATPKLDAKRKMKVKASEYKSLLPLSVIKHLIRKKEQEEKMQLESYWDEFAQSDIESDIEGDIKGDIEYVEPIPCESKSEGTFSPQQNKSFREKPLEKSIKILNNNKSIIEIDSFSNQPKKYFVNKEVKKLVENSEFHHLSKDEKYICGNKIQIFLSVYKLNLDDIAELVEGICPNYAQENANDLGGYFYKSLENAFLDSLLIENGVNLEELIFDDRAYDEIEELREQIKRAYFEGNSAYMEFATAIESKPKKAPKRKGKKPIRTELLPEWFDKGTEENEERDKKSAEESTKRANDTNRQELVRLKLEYFKADATKKIELKKEIEMYEHILSNSIISSFEPQNAYASY